MTQLCRLAKGSILKLDNLWDRGNNVYQRVDNEKDIVNLVKDYSAFDEEYAECLYRGGVHAFAGALRVFGLTNSEDAQNILNWNNPKAWKLGYKSFFTDVWAFAEDVFGYQFLFYKDGVGRLDIETGKIECLCKSFVDWISLILDEPDYYSGMSVALEWEKAHSNEHLTGKHHLCPVTLFVCGGKYQVDNLFRIESVNHMKVKSQIAEQIRDLPDGTPVEFTFE